jgi:preprotein translocase subunit SecG
MGVVKIILTVMEVIFSVGLIAVVLLQSGKEAGLSGAIAGNADTYMGKGKTNTLDQKLASWTKWIALVWAFLTLALGLI